MMLGYFVVSISLICICAHVFDIAAILLKAPIVKAHRNCHISNPIVVFLLSSLISHDKGATTVIHTIIAIEN